ncbi:MAG: efflux RND transporter periplasmic adaptor subunit [Vicinamibacteria bacterium]
MRARVVIPLLVLAGVAAVAGVRRQRAAAVTLDVDVVRRRPLFESFVTASGEIVATRYADIGSSVMGRLVGLRVKEGDAVREGQVLARIDPVQARSEEQAAVALLDALQAELRAAEARERDARQSLERTAELANQGLLPAADLDRAKAGADAARASVGSAGERVGQARAQLDRARDLVSKTELTAPMSGIVSRLNVREGEMVVIGVQNQPGTILMTVSDLSAINAEVKVAEADVLRLKLGQPAQVTLEAAPRRAFAGQVAEIGASALPTQGAAAAAREFRVVVRLDEADAALRPGLTCDARILAEQAKDALTAPLSAVVVRRDASGERSGVFAIEGGRARFVPVRTGLIGGLDVTLEGVAEGATIAIGPFQALRELQDGAAVRPRSR